MHPRNVCANEDFSAMIHRKRVGGERAHDASVLTCLVSSMDLGCLYLRAGVLRGYRLETGDYTVP